MSRQSYPALSRYNHTVTLQGQINTDGSIVSGYGFYVYKVGTGEYLITPKEDYYTQDASKSMSFCQAIAISNSANLTISDCRKCVPENVDPFGQYRLRIYDSTETLADPVAGFYFSITLSDSTGAYNA